MGEQNKKMSFPNLNLDLEQNLDILSDNKPDGTTYETNETDNELGVAKRQMGETGIVAFDAAEKIYQQIEASREEAEKGLVDSLTGCYNNSYLEKYKSENFHPQRDNNMIAIVFADINNLKVVNDTLGHNAGDELLRRAAALLNDISRQGDVVIREGGDEFVIVCRNDSDDKDFGHNLINGIIERAAQKDPTVSLAFGIAVYDEEMDAGSLDRTQARADAEMYMHKRDMKSRMSSNIATAVTSRPSNLVIEYPVNPDNYHKPGDHNTSSAA
jgi:diguanylate cyclase (GGDEF)-like protein